MKETSPNTQKMSETSSLSHFANQRKLVERDASIIDLQNKCKKYRVYYKLYKHWSGMRCKFCENLFDNEQFINHAQNWSASKTDENINSAALPEIKVHIIQTLIKEDELTRKPYTEYMLQVKHEGATWNVNRKYKDFCGLHSYLITNFPSIEFSKSSSIFYNKIMEFGEWKHFWAMLYRELRQKQCQK